MPSAIFVLTFVVGNRLFRLILGISEFADRELLKLVKLSFGWLVNGLGEMVGCLFERFCVF